MGGQAVLQYQVAFTRDPETASKGGSGVLPSRQASFPCRLGHSEHGKSSEDLNGRGSSTAGRAAATPA